MRKLTATVGAVLMAATSLALAPSAQAGDIGSSGPDLAGRWRSAALKMTGLGYAMTLRHIGGSSTNVYRARVAFLGAGAVPDTLGGTSVITLYGRDALWKWTGEPGQTKRLRGTLGNDGSLYFPTCWRLVVFAAKATADEDCLFQENASR